MAAGDPGVLQRNYSAIAVETTLTASISSSSQGASGTIIVGSVAGYPSTTPFTLVLDPDTSREEVVTVTATSGTTLTVVRGQDNTQAVAHSAGSSVRHAVSARDFKEEKTHAAARGYDIDQTILDNANQSHVHGIVTGEGVVVGTLKTQTLTNKTISTTSNNLVGVATTSGTETLTNKTIVSPTITGTGAIAGVFTGNLTGNVTGNSSTASTLSNARDFQLTGDIEASAVSFNGSSNVSLTTSIATGVIVNADINASAAIAATKIAGTAVTQADTGTVTSTMIADGTIVNADINASAGIAYGKLSLGGTITSADLVDGTIVNSDINASAAIALSKLAVDPLARANHTGTQLAATVSDFDTQVRTSRLDQMAAPTAAVSVNSQKITNLATPTSSGDAVPLGYITGQLGTANGIAPLDGSGKVPTDHLPALAISETFVVNSQTSMLALTAQVGDIAIRTDVNKSFILTATPASTLGNWQELLSPTDSVLSVDGTTGAVVLSGTYVNRTTGQLLGNLDANNFKVTGLGTPTSNADAATKAYVDTVAGSATAAASSAAAAAASYDSFDDRYLGAKSTAPSVDNDGNALLVGAIYWNTVTNAMYAWTGTEWGSISSTAAIYRYRFNATGGETSVSGTDANGLTLSYMPGKAQVYLNGVLLIPTTDYTASNGTSITSLAALASGDVLEVITFTSFELATAIEETIFDAKGDLLVGTAADTAGKLAVGTNGYVLKANSATATGLEWGAYDPLPSQGGNSGKYLTTNGSATSWGAITTDPNPSIFMLMGA